jgi:glycosyltransferase involved in cell wall biosynthesis
MNPLYVMTAPFPRIGGTDAVFQEVENLRARFGGDIVTAYPFSRPSAFVPAAWFGRSLARDAAALRARHDFIHLYAPSFRAYPFLSAIGLPVVYTVSASLGRLPARPPDWLRHVVSADESVVAQLRRYGAAQASLVLPGIDDPARDFPPPPAPSPFILTYASAPWTRAQFRTKGFELLLETLPLLPDVHLRLVWRGLFEKELRRLVRRSGMERQVSIVGGSVDVRDQIAAGHAAILLAQNSSLVKSYPHSLVEALQVGRPVVVSGTIAMAAFVRDRQLGAGVDAWSPAALADAIRQARSLPFDGRYHAAAEPFSMSAFLARHERIYSAAAAP